MCNFIYQHFVTLVNWHTFRIVRINMNVMIMFMLILRKKVLQISLFDSLIQWSLGTVTTHSCETGLEEGWRMKRGKGVEEEKRGRDDYYWLLATWHWRVCVCIPSLPHLRVVTGRRLILDCGVIGEDDATVTALAGVDMNTPLLQIVSDMLSIITGKPALLPMLKSEHFQELCIFQCCCFRFLNCRMILLVWVYWHLSVYTQRHQSLIMRHKS